MLGRWRLAIFTQFSLALTITTLCWSRLVFEPWSIKISLGVIAFVYLGSALACFLVKAQPNKHWLPSLSFIIICSVGLAIGFSYKNDWLGVGIYFVPSMSMHPTLKPGEFILVDTWVYQDKTPSLSDVVVFEHGIEKKHLVKRINPWPTGEAIKNNVWYVMGDNRNASQDSRYFGGITTEQLLGKVKLVLIALDKEHPLNIDIVLRPVH